MKNAGSIPSSASDDDLLRTWDRDHLWHPFTPQAAWAKSNPLVIDRGEGIYLFDSGGNRYLDATSSLWCNLHGHGSERIAAAIRKQLGKLAHSTLLGLSHRPAIELARRLVELAPEGLSRVFFSDDGATAVEIALKMAFQFWRQTASAQPQRTKFVALADAYHGDTIGAVSLGGVNRFHAMFQPLLFETLRAPAPYCYRCPLGLERPDCGIACLGEVDRILEAESGRVAAVVVEPLVQAAAGMIVHPPGYLSGLERICRERDVLLIADEVAVGFGRTGTMFACEQENVRPDFLCLAKGITGGTLPLAATLTTEQIHSAFLGDDQNPKTFYHGHTYTGNPLGAAAALANLEVFREEQVFEQLPAKIERFNARVDQLAKLSHVGDVRRSGLIAGVELVQDKTTKQPYPASETKGANASLAARRRGVLTRPLADVVVLMPPLSIKDDEIDFLGDVIEESIKEATETS